MRDEPTDVRVDRPIKRRMFVRNRWRAVCFVGHRRFLVGYPLPRPTGIDANQGNQGNNSNKTESAEDDDRYEPCPKALADLEKRGPSHSWSSGYL